MNRFHIEDLVEQDKHGVVFRARDEESGNIVSLRRFLPFGQDGGGLEKEEVAAFGSAAEHLSGISHVALRSVITGSADPIDGIPYLVTEWVEGMPLNEVLAGESMDPALVIDVLRIALEVSILLSEALGEEAVWVETEVESIVIGTKDSGRGFTFWISPFKWLGGEFQSRKLSSLIELGEELTGWKKKLVSDQAGHGLGGWLKWLKKNPDASLGEALETLVATTGNKALEPEVDLIGLASRTLIQRTPQPSVKMRMLISAAALLLLTFAALLFLRKPEPPHRVAAHHSSQDIPGAAAANVEVERAKPLSPAERATVRAAELRLEVGTSTAPAKRAVGKKLPQKQTPAIANDESPKIYTQDDSLTLAAKKVGSPVKLGGILLTVGSSAEGNSIYLCFSDPADPEKVAGVVHRKTFEGEFLKETFLPYLGKDLVLTGTCFKEPGGRMLVRILDKGMIRPVE